LICEYHAEAQTPALLSSLLLFIKLMTDDIGAADVRCSRGEQFSVLVEEPF